MSNETFFTKLFDIEKTPVRLYFALALVSGSIIYYKPAAIVEGKLYQDWEGVVWVIFYLFTVLFITTILFSIPSIIFRWIKNRIAKRKVKRAIVRTLSNLDEYEQSILREFYLFNVSSVKMPYNDATVSGLVAKKILSSPAVYTSQYATYYLNSKIRDLIEDKHIGFPDVREISSDDELSQIRDTMMTKRPYWVSKFNY